MSQLNIRESFASRQPAGAGDLTKVEPALSDFRQRTVYADVVAIRKTLQSRALRGRFFNPKLFSDPAWDMLLQLYAAAIANRRTTISRLAQRTGVPLTTTLRWIATLEGEGLITRFADRLDGRQVFLELTAQGHSAMANYFQENEEEQAIL